MAENSFEVELIVVGDKKMNVIQILRQITGADLSTIMSLVNSTPSLIMRDMPKEIAEALAKELESAGAEVNIIERGPVINREIVDAQETAGVTKSEENLVDKKVVNTMNTELKELINSLKHAADRAYAISEESDDETFLTEPLNDILMYANDALDMIQ